MFAMMILFPAVAEAQVQTGTTFPPLLIPLEPPEGALLGAELVWKGGRPVWGPVSRLYAVRRVGALLHVHHQFLPDSGRVHVRQGLPSLSRVVVGRGGADTDRWPVLYQYRRIR